MTPTEWGIVIAAIAAVPRGVTALENLGKAWFANRRSERPMSLMGPMRSSSSTKRLKAVAAEIEQAETVVKVNEIHEALAGKDPFTKAYVIPAHLERQTASLGVIRDEAVKQTQILQRIANNTPAPLPKPNTRY